MYNQIFGSALATTLMESEIISNDLFENLEEEEIDLLISVGVAQLCLEQDCDEYFEKLIENPELLSETYEDLEDALSSVMLTEVDLKASMARAVKSDDWYSKGKSAQSRLIGRKLMQKRLSDRGNLGGAGKFFAAVKQGLKIAKAARGAKAADKKQGLIQSLKTGFGKSGKLFYSDLMKKVGDRIKTIKESPATAKAKAKDITSQVKNQVNALKEKVKIPTAAKASA